MAYTSEPMLEMSVIATVLAPKVKLQIRQQMYAKLSLDLFAPGKAAQIYTCVEAWRKQLRRLPDADALASDPRTPRAIRDELPQLTAQCLKGVTQFGDAVVALEAWRGKRAVIHGCKALLKVAESESYDEEQAANLIRELQRRVTRPAGMCELVLDPRNPDLKQQVDEILAQAQEHQKKRWPTGWPTLDGIMSGGLGPLDVLLMAANTGGGKSMAALAMTMHLVEKGARVCYFAFEMSKNAMALRALAREAGATRGAMAGGQMTEEELDGASARFTMCYGNYAGHLRMYTPAVGFARPTLDYLEGIIQREPTDIVFVDYLSMVDIGLRNASDELRLRTITAELKMVAAATQTSVVGLMQLNEDGNDIKHSKGAKDAADFVITWSDKNPENVGSSYLVNILKKREQPGPSVDKFWLEQDYDHLRIYEPAEPPLKRDQVNVVKESLGGYGKL